MGQVCSETYLFLECLRLVYRFYLLKVMPRVCSLTRNFGTTRTAFRKARTRKEMTEYFYAPLEGYISVILFLVATWMVPS